MARRALEGERMRRVAILRTIEDEGCTARRQQRVHAVAAMEAERERRMYAMAVGDYWAAFASGVATQLSEEEQAERSKRRQWAAAAAQSELDRSHLLGSLSGEVERWAAAQSHRMQPLRVHVWHALRSVGGAAQRLWPTARVELFGSWSSGLQLPSSDVDLLVCDLPSDEPTHALLRRLAAALAQCESVRQLKIIDTARVPVIKAAFALPAGVGSLCEGAALQLDISLDAVGHSGRASTSLTRDVFLAHLPGLRPLVLLLKQLLARHELNCAATGGLGSYALVLMAASLLQQHTSLSPAPQGALGFLLVRFLEYFSALPETPDALHAVVVDGASRLRPRLASRSQLAASSRALGESVARSEPDAGLHAEAVAEAVYASSVLVQDPLSPKFANVSQAAFRWTHVQRCFRAALHRLHEALRVHSEACDEAGCHPALTRAGAATAAETDAADADGELDGVGPLLVALLGSQGAGAREGPPVAPAGDAT